MFSKDPSELTRKEFMDNEEIARAIRLSLAAELDAVNFYLQQSKLMPEGSFKKVHEDIAREEVTHFGEFMRLLYEYSPQDFSKIQSGWAEASDLLSKPASLTFNDNSVSSHVNTDEKMDLGAERYCHLISWNDNVITLPEDPSKSFTFNLVKHEYSIRRGDNDLVMSNAKKEAVRAFKSKVEDVLLENSPLSLSRRGKKINGGDWSKPGAITEDILSAVRRLSENNYNGDIRVVASFDAYNLLFKVSERFPEAEMRNLHKIVKNVYFSSSLKGKKIIVYSKDDIYCLVRREPETILLDETAELKNYVIISEITPLVYSPEGCFVISPEK